MFKTFAACAIAAVASAEVIQSGEQSFMYWIAKHNRTYSTVEEYTMRLARFLVVDAHIKMVNAPNSGYSHRAGHNKFSDHTEAEYEKMLNRKVTATEAKPLHGATHDVTAHVASPAEVDWRTSGCVTPPKDQGQCGSCWAFSVTETNETSNCLASSSKPLLTLSPQQLVDCVTMYNGCDGGDYWGAWAYGETSGQELNSAYPYTQSQGTCKYNSSLGKVGEVVGNPSVRAGVFGGATNAQMMSAISVKSNAVGINASGINFQSYQSGVLEACSRTGMNHAVVADGYNNTGSNPYWLVRNSWGSGWGEGGYIRIGMGSDGTVPNNGKGLCGINQDVGYPMTRVWSN